VYRRTSTLLLSGAFTLLLTVGASVAKVPYVAYQPGPTYDTLGEVGGTPVIAVDGRETFPTDGQLDLTTVSVRSDLTLAEALRGWFDRDQAVVPRELVFPPGQTTDEVRRRNEERKLESESVATTAALRELGIPFTTTVRVQGVEKGLPAEGRLEPDDVLTAIDGRPVESSQGVRDAISGTEPGTEVRISFERAGEPGEAVLTTASPESGEARSIIGVLLAEEPQFGFTIRITLQDVGGPSAGLMFALGIIDKLGPESLTGGRYVAGSGEIRPDGTVVPIGGIAQKVVAARDRGAEVFLVPEANCEQARERSPEGLLLVRVGSLDDALQALRALDEDERPPTC
jgi:Lon-like protease